MKRPAVFLDRDGVLNRAIVHAGKPHPPANLDEFEILPGVPEACEILRQEGFMLIVVTNQPDVARGAQRRDVVESINQTLCAQLPLDGVRVCYHDDADGCTCRKPLPGLLLEAAKQWDLDLASSFMVGDRWKDVLTGQRAGCKTVFIDYGYAEPGPATPDLIVRNLAEAVPWIVGQHK